MVNCEPTRRVGLSPRRGITSQPRVLTLGSAYKECALKVAPESGRDVAQTIAGCLGCAREVWHPFRAHRLKNRNPGLKPRAKIFCPFGAEALSV